VSDYGERNQNQFTKVLLWKFESDVGVWVKEGDDWYQWCLPVYRKPQGSWDETTNFARQKVWFAEKAFSEESINPNDLDFTPWMQCYWDSQAGRWVVVSPSQPQSAILIMTPTAGIPARVGTTLGVATCETYSISSGNELIPTGNSVEVLNMTATPVEGDAYGQAKRISGRWVIDVEECEVDEPSSSSSSVVP
jgi:hypothetical protein